MIQPCKTSGTLRSDRWKGIHFKKFMALLITFSLITISSGTFTDVYSSPDLSADDLTDFPAPDFTLSDIKGTRISLHDFRGSVVYVTFWATWCETCRQEIKNLNELIRHFQGKKFVVIAISTDLFKETLLKFLKNYTADYIILHDSESTVARKYKAYSLPATFIIDKQGKVSERIMGPHDKLNPDFLKKIDRLL